MDLIENEIMRLGLNRDFRHPFPARPSQQQRQVSSASLCASLSLAPYIDIEQLSVTTQKNPKHQNRSLFGRMGDGLHPMKTLVRELQKVCFHGVRYITD